jgi:F-type H+-transporting ATPase subunit epsilon
MDSCRTGWTAWQRLHREFWPITDVFVSVRNAIGGTDLGQLHEAVKREFLSLSEGEQSVRSVMAAMESDFIRRLAGFHHE